MWILALDASLACCSAALLGEGRILAQRRLPGDRGHASALPPMAAEVLAEAGAKAADLDAVAVVVGPGGFTGLRAGLALAQGIALGAGLPVIGVTTGEALAAALPEPVRAGHAVWAVVDNRRGRVVLERFAPGAMVPLGLPQVFGEAELPPLAGPVVVVGDGAPLVAAWLAERGAEVMLSEFRLPDAAAVARVAAQRLAGRLPPLAARPLYVEPPAVRPPPPLGA